jgi:hypothetical protein
MKYSKKQFGSELKKKLNEEVFDVVKISQWSNKKLIDHTRDIDDELYELLFELSTMDDDPQFEYSEDELLFLANNLIKNDPDALKKTNDLENIDVEDNKSE